MSIQRVDQIINHLCVSRQDTVAKSPKVLKVCVTGAAGNIAYALVFQICSGAMLGSHQHIELRLLDIPPMLNKVKGVEMELMDCAFPLVAKIVATDSYDVAFQDCDIAILVGAKPRGPGMQRKDLLAENAKIFSGQGKAINQVASRNVKVLVVGNPANTNALIASTNAPNIPKENFTALTRLDMNRALAQVSQKIKTPVENIKNVIIWGNHSSTQYPDVNHAVYQSGEDVRPLRAVINDDKWIQGEFLSTVQERGAAIIKARGLSSAASAANAAIDHVRDWIIGTPKGTFVSMAVPSDGSYGIPTGIIYSFPVTCRDGRYTIVKGLAIDEFSRKKMDATAKELVEEKIQAFSD